MQTFYNCKTMQNKALKMLSTRAENAFMMLLMKLRAISIISKTTGYKNSNYEYTLFMRNLGQAPVLKVS